MAAKTFTREQVLGMLGLAHDAKIGEITNKIRELQTKWHPDKFQSGYPQDFKEFSNEVGVFLNNCKDYFKNPNTRKAGKDLKWNVEIPSFDFKNEPDFYKDHIKKNGGAFHDVRTPPPAGAGAAGHAHANNAAPPRNPNASHGQQAHHPPPPPPPGNRNWGNYANNARQNARNANAGAHANNAPPPHNPPPRAGARTGPGVGNSPPPPHNPPPGNGAGSPPHNPPPPPPHGNNAPPPGGARPNAGTGTPPPGNQTHANGATGNQAANAANNATKTKTTWRERWNNFWKKEETGHSSPSGKYTPRPSAQTAEGLLSRIGKSFTESGVSGKVKFGKVASIMAGVIVAVDVFNDLFPHELERNDGPGAAADFLPPDHWQTLVKAGAAATLIAGGLLYGSGKGR